ncbi:hypothetical protein CHS0354_017920 [Potamilus streckersoni]|uniref:RING-type domain-containing protein n=1 Tax=Potamilus streckersoni TaxID=2493646 RepID=A0AAE0VL28_9BIVA|nr:hypothetical protein CHS0354_017920 [Potamilus streckersoni]
MDALGDAFVCKKEKNGIEDAHIIETFVVCDNETFYENPLVPNSGRNSAACEKEVCCTTKETTRYPQFSQNSTRLATFVHGLFFIEHQTLADLGFFYKGQGDGVCCYECGVSLSQWKRDDDPLLEHIRYSPECRYLSTIIDTTTLQDYKAQLLIIRGDESRQGATGVGLHVTSSQDERRKTRSPEYSSYNVRLSTFARFPAISGLDIKQIAAAGFYYTDHQDIVRCYACDGGLKQWEAGDDPWEEHSRWFPDCHHLKQSNYQMPEKKTKAEIGSIAHEKKTVASVENASLSEGLAQRLKTLTLKEQEPKQQEAELDMNTPAVLAVLHFGYSRKSAIMAINELRKRGTTTITANGIMQVLVSFEDRGISLPADDEAKDNDSKHSILSDLQNISSKDLLSEEQLAKRKTNKTLTSGTINNEICHLQEENKKLTKHMMCKRCKEMQRNILVLPCTHFCLCEHCSKEVSLCPECWKPIKERVKTYIA